MLKSIDVKKMLKSIDAKKYRCKKSIDLCHTVLIQCRRP